MESTDSDLEIYGFPAKSATKYKSFDIWYVKTQPR